MDEIKNMKKIIYEKIWQRKQNIENTLIYLHLSEFPKLSLHPHYFLNPTLTHYHKRI